MRFDRGGVGGSASRRGLLPRAEEDDLLVAAARRGRQVGGVGVGVVAGGVGALRDRGGRVVAAELDDLEVGLVWWSSTKVTVIVPVALLAPPFSHRPKS